ncbi:hypothetical protein CRE08_06815 [Escherichia coli]|nr:hypothetical protein COD30_18230 [Escherichia coli]PIM64927.1 hypothetical protein CTI77_03350 [Escherichia coli]RFQ66715.1 hypothetical protein CRE03_14520 [Escherichia coli]RFQ96908.1 hypothetical protein CRE08_06815 [Escherichia coli]
MYYPSSAEKIGQFSLPAVRMPYRAYESPVCRPDKASTPHPAFGTRFTELKNPQLYAAFNRHDLPVRIQHGHD